MSPDLRYRVVRSDGIRSKLVSAERVIEMYRAGKITEDSVVQQDGSKLEMPVRVFVDLNSIGRDTGKAKSRSTFVPFEKTHETTAREYDPVSPAYVAMNPPKPERFHAPDADEPLHLFGGLWHFLSFQGMKIPRHDRKATHTYLSYQITWLERYLKVVHFFSVLYTWIFVCGLAFVVASNLKFVLNVFAERGVAQGLLVVSRFAWGYLLHAVLFLLGFLLLRVLEAILRLIPACLRYWMAISEDSTPQRKS